MVKSQLEEKNIIGHKKKKTTLKQRKTEITNEDINYGCKVEYTMKRDKGTRRGVCR